MDHPAVVYRFLNADGELLYVGCTSMGAFRWTYHMVERPWWREVATVTVEHFDHREDALGAETKAIQDEHPRYNRMTYHGPRPPSLGIKRRKNEGSIYHPSNSKLWYASIRLRGERFFFRGTTDRADAERWLANFRREHGLEDVA